MLALFAVVMLFMPGLPLPGTDFLGSQPAGEVYAALPSGAGAARRIAMLGTASETTSLVAEAASNSTTAEDSGGSANWNTNATALVLEPGSHAASVALQHLQVLVRVVCYLVLWLSVISLLAHVHQYVHIICTSLIDCTQEASSTALVWDPSLAASHPALLELMPQWASLPALLGAPLATDGLLAPLSCDKVHEVHASSLPDHDKLRKQVAAYAASLERRGRAVPLLPVGAAESEEARDEPWRSV